MDSMKPDAKKADEGKGPSNKNKKLQNIFDNSSDEEEEDEDEIMKKEEERRK